MSRNIPWELNLSWVTEELAVGGRFPMEAAAYLAGVMDIRRVVDVRVEEVDDEVALRAHGIELLHLPTLDRKAVSLPMLNEGVRWVNAQVAGGNRVYIHCQHGIGRSALVCLCVLVSRGMSPVDALELVKRSRPQLTPSPEQLAAFLEWCRLFGASQRACWHAPSLDLLMRIAYRHLRAPTSATTAVVH